MNIKRLRADRVRPLNITNDLLYTRTNTFSERAAGALDSARSPRQILTFAGITQLGPELPGKGTDAMRRLLFVLINTCVLASGMPRHIARGSPVPAYVSTATRVDMSENRIVCESNNFHINLTSLWSNYLSAERESVDGATEAGTPEVLEKINFYYEPQDKLLKPAYLISILIYDKSSRNDITQRKILETTDYIIAADTTEENPFTNPTDMGLFDRFLKEANDDAFVANMIKIPFPISQTQSIYNSVFVNGSKVRGETFTGVNGVVYIPVRAPAEALGYQIDWLPSERVVFVSGFGTFYVFSADGKIPNPDYITFMLNGVAYVPTLFFASVLKANVEIDERKNVFIDKLFE
ncbi:MAG: copper amine oxidase N-terminal domain-containing protein [Clostridiales bacterium]|nr:copper amine oxidase N-terminal domain-containing protein [Clostridiales bacterium]